MAKLDPKKRKEVETFVINLFDTLDKSGVNSKYYKDTFAKMSDDEFLKLFHKKFPLRFHMRTGTTNPSMTDIKKTLKFMNVPLSEKIYTGYLYTNKDGVPVATQECTVIYMHLKKVQQFITHKNKWSSSIANRDLKTGRLIGKDKGAVTSDREFESMASWGLTHTMEEFSNPRADDMEAKNFMFNQINSTGMFKLKDLPRTQETQLSRNLFNTYLIGAHISSNLVNKDNYTVYSLRKKKNFVVRS